MNIRIFIIFLLFWQFGIAYGQAQYQCGGNYQVFSAAKLRLLSTKNFEIAYSEEHEELAKITSEYAEAAFFELTKIWDYQLKTKVRIYVFPNYFQYQAYATSFQPNLFKNNVQFGLHRNIFFSWFTGDKFTFFQQMKTSISKLIIYDQFLGKSNYVFQNNLLVFLPEWFVQGAAHFMGEGWTENDEILMRSAHKRWDILLTEANNSALNIAVRKSFWYFIAKEWKKEKISEIFYMTRLTRSIDGGLLTVLGQTHRTIQTRWEAFCESFFVNSEIEPEPVFRLKTSQELLGWDANDAYIVGLIKQNSKVYPFVYDIQNQIHTVYSTPLEWIVTDYQPYQVSVKLHSKKPQFVFPSYENQIPKIGYFDLTTRKIQHYDNDLMLDGFLQFSWSPDEQDLVFSGFKNGVTDLYLRKNSGKTEKLTKTKTIDEQNPVFGNSNVIYYSAPTIDASNPTYELLGVQNVKDLYQLQLDSKVSTVVSISSYDQVPLTNHSKGLIIKSHQANPTQLIAYQPDLRNFEYITNEKRGIYSAAIANQKSFQAYFFKGKLHIFSLKFTNSVQIHFRDKNIFHPTTAWKEELSRRKIQKKTDEIILAQDTSETMQEEKKRKVKYYVFDEGDTVKVSVKSEKKKKSKKEHVRYEQLFFTIDKAKTEEIQNHSTAAVVKYVRSSLELDPVFRLGIRSEMLLSDAGNTQELKLMFTPFLKDFQSSYLLAEYKKRFKPFDFLVGIDKKSRYFKDPHWVRYNDFTAWIGANKNISLYDRLSVKIENTQINRYDLRLTDQNDLNGKNWTHQIKLGYHYEKLKKIENYVLNGSKVDFVYTAAGTSSDKKFLFSNFYLDARKYTELMNHIVLLTRFTGAFSIGSLRPRYFTGGWEQWVNANFENKKDLPLTGPIQSFYYSNVITPIRGFDYNARNGTQYMLMNAELRIPTNYFIKRPTSATSLHNFQLIMFGSIGSAWTTGNPFSQKNPIDAKTIESPPLTITVQSLKSPFIGTIGFGARFAVLGYPIRVDVALPIEDNSFTKTKIGLSLDYEF